MSATFAARLLARIHRRFQTTTQTLLIGELRIPFTRITNPDVVLDQVAAEEDRREKQSGQRHEGDELHLPYWAELWESGLGIGQMLVASPQLARDKNVLDLGCGMGLAGTVAAALGGNVLFADLEADSLLFAALNSLPWRANVRTRRLNWQKDRLDERFDLILGADILYEKIQWPFLEPFWRNHLAPGGSVLLGEPGRQTGDLFLEWIRQKPWKLELSEQPVITRPRPIRLFQLSPNR
ncbi:MAG TPA: methyltransferase [Tepidisphaeraceae bacterium]|jgi:predicted nicotinamide N-methyase|nr:methyltransferase [Tepidisphaeraceae bacterium]